jgi:hypothetical protein
VTQAQAEVCKAKGQVFYNGGCQRRGNSCNGGKGYLGQVAGNIGWGVCINFGTRPPKITAPKQTNPKTSGCPSTCYNLWGQATSWIPGCGGCQGPGSALPPIAPRTPSGGGGTPSGAGDPDADCNSWGIAKPLCVGGKSLTKGATTYGDPIGRYMPLFIGGGLVMAMLVLMKR